MSLDFATTKRGRRQNGRGTRDRRIYSDLIVRARLRGCDSRPLACFAAGSGKIYSERRVVAPRTPGITSADGRSVRSSSLSFEGLRDGDPRWTERALDLSLGVDPRLPLRI